MVDITNKAEVFKLLENLKQMTVPKFGKFTPQHMVEHLYVTVMLSNGKIKGRLNGSEEQAGLFKKSLIYSDREFPMNFKAPMLGDNPAELELPDLQAALKRLNSELDDFDLYFSRNPSDKPLNPSLGALDKNEWIIFHNKHFAHHFKQFNLL